ncbi:MAG: phosphopantetheine-binding protein [Nocardioides sp.]|nr:phosphopantetheine-binding protein [Nocardioides sp.]
MMTREQAAELVGREIRRIVPDAELDGIGPDTDLRRAFELDSLDFLSLVEMLSTDAGVRIDEEDYPELASMSSSTDFLVRRTAAL